MRLVLINPAMPFYHWSAHSVELIPEGREHLDIGQNSILVTGSSEIDMALPDSFKEQRILSVFSVPDIWEFINSMDLGKQLYFDITLGHPHAVIPDIEVLGPTTYRVLLFCDIKLCPQPPRSLIAPVRIFRTR